MLFLALTGCAHLGTPGGHASMTPMEGPEAMALATSLDIASQGLSSWMDLAPALGGSLKYVQAQPPQEHPFTGAAKGSKLAGVTWEDLGRTLRELLDLLPELAQNPKLLGERFTWIRVTPDPLLTGYYEAEVRASLTPDATYAYPLYACPPELKAMDMGAFHPDWTGQTLHYRLTPSGIEPFHSRQAIDQDGALAHRSLEIAWADDPIDVYFLQIQGSGRLLLEDGSARHILYAGTNGRPYVSLGDILVERGLLAEDAVSKQSITAYLREHPEDVAGLLALNPRYTFFRLADSGPYGASGVSLTPMVSVASRREFLPMGAVAALMAPLPIHENDPDTGRLAGLTLVQDAGALRPQHLDLFCGHGARAAFQAGKMRDDTEAYILLQKGIIPSP